MTCPRAGKLFGGCKFSPRYDTGPATAWPTGFKGPAMLLEQLVEKARQHTYVRDVCERCGSTVERGSPAAAEGTAGEAMGHNPAVGAA